MSTGPDASLDEAALRACVGRQAQATDVLTQRLVQGLCATLNEDVPRGGIAPPAIHWCLAPVAVPGGELGPDGHPARGGFLPDTGLPRRMWAGGRLKMLAPLQAGDAVTRTSVIEEAVLKRGRTGPLCFVTVRHEVAGPRGPVLREWQDIVYRGIGAAAPLPDPVAAGRWVRAVSGDAVTLFRYSALTFNGHRIHYDRRYATADEGYPGLVVHGPLQATWLLHLARDLRGAVPAQFSFRAQMPLFDGDAITLNADEDGAGLRLWTADGAGRPAMVASAEW